MKTETLEKANNLKSEINELKNHLADMKPDRETPYEGEKAVIRVENNFQNRNYLLRHEFLPFSIPEFMELYISRIEKKIKQLEKEFEKL